MRLLTFITLFLLSSTLGAFTLDKYSEKAVTRDQFQKNSYVLQFYAEWCLICQQQKFMLKEISTMEGLPPFTVYETDFDFEKALKDKHKVERQSLLIAFKNGVEVNRSLGLKDKEKLKDFLKESFK